jgi:Carboxypeptidase regulatory-like domain
MGRTILNCVAVALLGSCLLAPAWGQGIGGSIAGRVKDQRGDPVQAAFVQLVNTASQQIRAVSTDGEGRYEAREMPPGSYEVTIVKGGFNTARVSNIQLSVTEVLQLEDVTLGVAPVGSETVEVQSAASYLVEASSATESTAFSHAQIRELPILTRDVNNLSLLAPGVVSSNTFSFASTLVPFAVNGSRGRDVNFIIDSVDNNEPLFGGAATQFTNTDLFAEYRILTSQYKAEFGRNSGGVVNMITRRGGNTWHGSAFWFAQNDALNATNLGERMAGLTQPAPLKENVLGAAVGGPIKKDSTWFFASYQGDWLRNDLTSLYPQIATLPTVDGLNALSLMPQTRTLAAFLNNPTVGSLPVAAAPCVNFITAMPASNPCTVGSVSLNGRGVNFGTYLVPDAGVFDVHDHQLSYRLDHRLTQKDDLSARYLVDDLWTPRDAGASPMRVGFFDVGLLPGFSDVLAQRTQNAGVFWTHAWSHALHELRLSYSRNASQFGDLTQNESARETLPAVTVFDDFALGTAPGGTKSATGNFFSAFPTAGSVFTLGLDSRPAQIRSNLYQVQDNFSYSGGRQSLKFGANLVRTISNIRDISSDLGEYFYFDTGTKTGFQTFTDNDRVFALQVFPNFGGRGGEVLPLRVFSQFYFAEDDIRWKRWLTVSLGLRYENFGQAVNRIAELNPNFGPKISPDNKDFGPRVGLAMALGSYTALRAGYGIYYNPTPYNIALAAWRSGRVSPFIAGTPSNVYPQPPFNAADVLTRFTDCESQIPTSGPGPTYADCTNQDAIAASLRQPLSQTLTMSLQRQIGQDVLFEVGYSGNVSTQLYERLNSNPRTGWRILKPCPAPPDGCAVAKARRNPNRREITTVGNGARSSYHSLQASMTKRYARPGFFHGLALTASYTWSHMIDTSSEIFGPDVRRVRSFRTIRQEAGTVEVITPFAQDPDNPHVAERGNSSFDRRHRGALSFLWSLPEPAPGGARALLRGWQLGGVLTAQTGQPFSPINSYGACTDANGDGTLSNDRPSLGNVSAPLNSVALVADPRCVSIAPTTQFPTGYKDASGNSIDPATAHFVQVPLGLTPGTPFTVGAKTFVAGNVGRNTLMGPRIINLDFSLLKNFHVGERASLQLRLEVYDLLNKANAGIPIGNVFSAGAQSAPALAFGSVAPSPTPARVTGLIPENTLDAFDAVSGGPLFLSQRFMNTSSRRIQAAVKFIF